MLDFLKAYGKNLFVTAAIITLAFTVIYSTMLFIMMLFNVFGPAIGILIFFTTIIIIGVAVFTIIDMSTR